MFRVDKISGQTVRTLSSRTRYSQGIENFQAGEMLFIGGNRDAAVSLGDGDHVERLRGCPVSAPLALSLAPAFSSNGNTRSDKVDSEDPAGCGTIVVRPARMNAGIATDQLSVVHYKPVRVTGVWNEVHRLQHLARRGFVPHQTRPALTVTLTVVADDLPDG